ncbi:two component sensor histidine kinase [Neokomagataea thailandica NBRC 106555]|uniref:histidine kinase n=2 Tax=Neokomagataea TaxID=1223423 RepID=A0A4Y6V6J3_9PROT|nr:MULTISPECIES: ATP-binding protein [Neokomagataea]QDH24221.1 HAMP domain-containing protein [Neokomagataea tanensis]GBR52830.1 two component sensor histidine kinase [Neokomagataea thailandica NBRC 106555]
MFQTDIFRTATFRLTLAFVVAIIAGVSIQFMLVYGQMANYERARSTDFLRREADMLVRETPQELESAVRDRTKTDLRVILNGAALFDQMRNPIVGDIHAWPEGLQVSSEAQRLWVVPQKDRPFEMRFLAVEVPDLQGHPTGRILVLARSMHMADELRYITKRSALMSVVPIVLFALLAGVFLSHRALARVKEMREAIVRIMGGDLQERLPVGRERDDIERLASAVNRMLDRLEHLLDEIRDVGNDIAHDLRTPLARVRASLERVSGSEDVEHLNAVVQRATQDLDQCFSIITALLRIGELENGRRRAGFAVTDLADVAAGIIDLYEPIAETQGITLRQEGLTSKALLYGDADLLSEVLANLVDNAIKFTPEGGEVGLRVDRKDDETIIVQVTDTGIGIPEHERGAVMGRFYRSDKSRHIPGSGLGLSLVSAILDLHGATLSISANRKGNVLPGSVFTMSFQARTDAPVENNA